MATYKTTYICSNCGTESIKWQGKCPSCGAWNTLVEEVVERNPKITVTPAAAGRKSAPQNIADITTLAHPRISVPDIELERVLGGGLMPGSLVLLGGEPGIGKSTLLLQMALQVDSSVLYVSGEESAQQIRQRAERIGMHNENCYILTETTTDVILREAKTLAPSIIIIDSIQTLTSPLVESSAGSIVQIRESTAELQQYVKSSNVPIFIIGHINKDGLIAGPKLLEHMVDTVLQFEGDRHYTYRILRTLKNRFGSSHEIGIYDMQGGGLRPVTNPSEILITQRPDSLSGISIGATMEGARPLLIEVQALVTQAVYGTPQRTTNGFDVRRLHMLLAVLEKRCGFPFGNKDVYLNIAGGLRVDDPAIDLAVVAALISSFEDIPIPMHSCFAAEVGLSGEIRAVGRIEQRISEAARLGFEKIMLSSYNMKGLMPTQSTMEVKGISRIEELIKMIV